MGETEFDLNSAVRQATLNIAEDLLARHQEFYDSGSEDFKEGMATGVSWALSTISLKYIKNKNLTGVEAGNALNDLLGKLQEERGETDGE